MKFICALIAIVGAAIYLIDACNPPATIPAGSYWVSNPNCIQNGTTSTHLGAYCVQGTTTRCHCFNKCGYICGTNTTLCPMSAATTTQAPTTTAPVTTPQATTTTAAVTTTNAPTTTAAVTTTQAPTPTSAVTTQAPTPTSSQATTTPCNKPAIPANSYWISNPNCIQNGTASTHLGAYCVQGTTTRCHCSNGCGYICQPNTTLCPNASG